MPTAPAQERQILRYSSAHDNSIVYPRSVLDNMASVLADRVLHACPCYVGVAPASPHLYLRDIEAHLVGNGNDGLEKCHQGLLWLKASVEEIDCPRFLLRVREVMRGKSARLADGPALFWETYGDVLGELLRREAERGDSVDSATIWAELSDDFRVQSVNPWSQRAARIQCFTRAARRCHRVLANRRSAHYTDFWRSIEYFTAYLVATQRSPVPLTSDFTIAAKYLLEMWYQIVDALDSNGRAISDDPRGHLALTRMGYYLFGILDTMNLLGSQLLNTWFTPMRRVAGESAGRSSGVQAYLDDLARDIAIRFQEEASQEVRQRLRRIQLEMLPMVHRRAPRPPRLSMEPEDEQCEVELLGAVPLTHTATIIDVCEQHVFGFYIAIRAVRIHDLYDGPRGLTGEFVAEWPCREIAISAAVGSVIVLRDVSLRIWFAAKSRSIVGRCKVLRAWPLEDLNGIGLAVIGDPADQVSMKPEYEAWMAYVRTLSLRSAEGRA